MAKTTKTHGGARKGAGRPKTSVGWATISIALPRPIVQAYRALPEAEKAELRAKVKALLETLLPLG
jgi:hypothetical protein